MSTILIVDDEFALAQMLGELLVMRGHRVTLAINGQLALAHLHDGTFDLVVCDVMMPIMTGPEMVVAMRAESRFDGIPVILMSSQPRLCAAPFEQGLVQHVLAKPFTARALYDALDGVLARPALGS